MDYGLCPRAFVPRAVMENLEREFQRFLWGNNDDSRGRYLVSWQKICKSHKDDGQAMEQLAKVFYDTPSLWTKMIKK